MASIEEKRRKRLQFMHRLHEATGGAELAHVNMFELGDELGWPREETQLVVEYLRGEELIAYAGGGGTIGITHNGVVEVEESLSNPRQQTEHFPPAINIINIDQMHGSQIQQGTVGSQQHGQFLSEADREPLQELVTTLRAVLPDAGLAEEDRLQAEAELATVEAQLSAPKPKRSFIRASLESVRDLLVPLASLAGRSAELTQAVEQLHKQLPGI
jgi:hypothetical protein